jgi:hypothetical protein
MVNEKPSQATVDHEIKDHRLLRRVEFHCSATATGDPSIGLDDLSDDLAQIAAKLPARYEAFTIRHYLEMTVVFGGVEWETRTVMIEQNPKLYFVNACLVSSSAIDTLREVFDGRYGSSSAGERALENLRLEAAEAGADQIIVGRNGSAQPYDPAIHVIVSTKG